jgi:hypothetical protein
MKDWTKRYSYQRDGWGVVRLAVIVFGLTFTGVCLVLGVLTQ